MKNLSEALRLELIRLAEKYVASQGLEPQVYRSLGTPPTVLFREFRDGEHLRHGNFHPDSYPMIVSDADWRRRLKKPHSRKSALAPADRSSARELDSCSSSDALLMNVFCHPSAIENAALARIFGLDQLPKFQFGFRPKLLLADDKRESTEIDLCFGPGDRPAILAEAKLTEGDFTDCPKSGGIVRYRFFTEVFDADSLPQTLGTYRHYQLLRNIQAAHERGSAFYLIHDERRPDLRAAWRDVVAAIAIPDLAGRCRAVTWQEIAAVSEIGLREFLDEKYGIA